MVKRSDELILVALFLSRDGRKVEGGSPLPPPQLGTDRWKVACAGFYDALAKGRSLCSFRNSLKATRDQFDSHVDSGRRGWRVDGKPKPLPKRDAAILDTWRSRSKNELWQAVSSFWDANVTSVQPSILNDLEAESDQVEEKVFIGREGKSRAIASRVRERSPRLRAAALEVHGYQCQVCGFDFEKTYGAWGRGFAEVHHVRELSTAPPQGVEVDPVVDLAVVCSNCHRMIHRKAKRALRLAELRRMVTEVSESESRPG